MWVDRPYSPEGLPSQDPIYHVNNTVAITVRDLDQVGTTLGAAIDAGANSVNGITFNISEPDELRSDARQAATEDALAKAQELATLQGVEIGDVVTVSEVIGGTGPIFDSSQVAFAEGIGGGGVGPISPGEVEIVVRLQVTYQIK